MKHIQVYPLVTAACLILMPTCVASQSISPNRNITNAVKEAAKGTTETPVTKNLAYVLEDYVTKRAKTDAVFEKAGNNIKRINELTKALAGTPTSEIDVLSEISSALAANKRLEDAVAYGDDPAVKRAAESLNRAADAAIPKLECNVKRLKENLILEC